MEVKKEETTDTSKEYIKMCEKAREIQAQRNPVWHMVETRACFLYDSDDAWFVYAVGEGKDMVLKKVWLPRQGQLQGMVIEHPGDNYNKSMYPTLESLYLFACSMYTKSEPPWTMEQLWLAFVMKEKYGKVWDGEEWK